MPSLSLFHNAFFSPFSVSPASLPPFSLHENKGTDVTVPLLIATSREQQLRRYQKEKKKKELFFLILQKPKSMVRLTLIARAADGLPLAEGLDAAAGGRDQALENAKQQARAVYKSLAGSSRGGGGGGGMNGFGAINGGNASTSTSSSSSSYSRQTVDAGGNVSVTATSNTNAALDLSVPPSPTPAHSALAHPLRFRHERSEPAPSWPTRWDT